jgi:hypothetical protein
VRENVNRARKIWDKVILWTCVAIGFLIGAFICWKSWTGVPNHDARQTLLLESLANE